MAKAPIPGQAKTRLGRDIGDDRAAAFYQCFLLDTLAVIAETGSRLDASRGCLLCPDARHETLLRKLVGSSWRVRCQQRPGLMGGILDAFDDGFDQNADVVVVTDADSPSVSVDQLVDCAELATEHDIVLGPTADGGYYLIAAQRTALPRLADLLLGERFDGATICQATVRRARALELSTALGTPGFDVDTLDELRHLAAELPSLPPTRLAHTRRALAEANPFRAPSAGAGPRACPRPLENPPTTSPGQQK